MLEQIKNAFQRNLIKKIVALILSMALWFFVMGSQDPTINGTYEVPLSIANVSPKCTAIYDERDIRVKLSAPRSYFIDYGTNNIRAFANMAGYEAGEYEVPIETSFPKGFELDSIYPEKIHVKIDPIIERQIPVELIVTGSPMKGSRVSELEKSSENLTLIGAKSAVENVKRVIGYVVLNSSSETFEQPVPMTAIDEDGREVGGVRVAPSVITVTVNIEREIITKIVPIIADLKLPSGREIAKLKVLPEFVEISGFEEKIEHIDSIKTESISFPEDKNSFSGVIKLIIPEGISTKIEEADVIAELKE